MPAELKMFVVCMDCKALIEEGDPGAHTSHGLCDRCFVARMKRLDNLKRERVA